MTRADGVATVENENVPNFSFLMIGSAGAAGRRDFEPKMAFVVLAVPRHRRSTYARADSAP